MLNSDRDSVGTVRWITYKCPECGHIFSLSSAIKLTKTKCPSCGSEIPLIEHMTEFAKIEPQANKVKRRKRVTKKKKEDTLHSWDSDDDKKPKQAKISSVLWVFLFCILFSFLVVGSFIFYTSKSKDNLNKIIIDNNVESKYNKPSLMRYTDEELLDLTEPLVEKLLNLSRVEDLLPIIAYPDKCKDKIANHYPEGVIEPVGMIPFGSDTKVLHVNNCAIILAKNKDHKDVEIVFVETTEGLKIYWDSYVVWSEMPWQDFVKEKPTKSILVRAKYRAVDYYNFDFSDDNQWSCYEISSSDDNYVFYGYVERGSDLDVKLNNGLECFVGVTLKISYPDQARTSNQILIHERLADGWVMHE